MMKQNTLERLLLTAMLLFATMLLACTPKYGMLHLQPMKIWENAVAAAGDEDKVSFREASRLQAPDSPPTVVVRLFADTILAPTGVYLSDEESHITETSEMYFNEHMSAVVFDYFVEQYQAAGIPTFRMYSSEAPSKCAGGEAQTLRILELTIHHAELHRWKQKADEGFKLVDLVAFTYSYAWKDCTGKALYSSEVISQDFVSAESADELFTVASIMAVETAGKLAGTR
ncbi:MAG TPA: hypothetical protein PLC24_12690 [Myxococcota bacterium]|nr:hypothetical protein [Myxococcota bacterium]